MNKILVGIVRDGTGGVDSYILSLCKMLYKHGYSVDLLCSQYSDSNLDKYKLYCNNIIKISRLTHKSRIFDDLKKINKSNSYDIFYLNLSSSLMYVYASAAKKAGIKKIISHSHASAIDEPNRFKNTLFSILHICNRSRLNKISNVLFACSKVSAEWTFGKKEAKRKCVIVNNPIATKSCCFDSKNRNEYRDKLHIGKRFVIGCTSGFRFQKNVSYCIDVMREIVNDDKDAILLLVGSGPLEKDIKDYAKNNLESRNYRFLGERDDVPKLLSVFDSFILPSYNEGLGMSLIEAQAADLNCYINIKLNNEAIISKDRVYKLPLSSAKTWAKEILQHKNHKRDSKAYMKVEKAGFNESSLRVVLDYLK